MDKNLTVVSAYLSVKPETPVTIAQNIYYDSNF